MHPRTEMLDLIVVDGRARGIVARDLVTGEIATYFADAVVLATGGYGNVFYLSTNAKNSNATAIWRAHRRGAYFANPCFTQIHPTCIPRSGDHQSKLTLMSESLRNDGRIWVPKAKGDDPPAARDPRGRARLLPGADLPRLRQPGPPRHRLPRREERLRRGPRRRPRRAGRLPRLRRRDRAPGPRRRSRRSTATSSRCTQRITGENPYEVPMRIYPAIHYTMGGLWVDYDLQTTIPGLFVIGEANFSDHGANRLGACALMQGLADGYFVLPATLNDYLARSPALEPVDARPPGRRRGAGRDVEDRLDLLLAVNGDRTADSFHRELGELHLGHAAAWPAARPACARRWSGSRELREEFWRRRQGARHRRGAQPVAGEGQPGRRLPRVRRADVPRRAAPRRVLRRPLPRGVARPPTARRCATTSTSRYAAAWEFTGAGAAPVLHKEDLDFEYVHPTQRSYA